MSLGNKNVTSKISLVNEKRVYTKIETGIDVAGV